MTCREYSDHKFVDEGGSACPYGDEDGHQVIEHRPFLTGYGLIIEKPIFCGQVVRRCTDCGIIVNECPDEKKCPHKNKRRKKAIRKKVSMTRFGLRIWFYKRWISTNNRILKKAYRFFYDVTRYGRRWRTGYLEGDK